VADCYRAILLLRSISALLDFCHSSRGSCPSTSRGQLTVYWSRLHSWSDGVHQRTSLVLERCCQGPTKHYSGSDQLWERLGSTSCHSQSLHWQRTHDHWEYVRRRSSSWVKLLYQRTWALSHAPSIDCNSFQRHTMSRVRRVISRVQSCSSKLMHAIPCCARGKLSRILVLQDDKAPPSTSSHTPSLSHSTSIAQRGILRSCPAPNLFPSVCESTSHTSLQPLCNGTYFEDDMLRLLVWTDSLECLPSASPS